MKLSKFVTSAIAAAGTSILIGASSAFAADSTTTYTLYQPTANLSSQPTGTTDISAFISGVGGQILTIALTLIGVVAVLYLVFYGFQYVTSGGDPDKAKKARAGIINAVIGIIVVVIAFTIVHFAETLGSAANSSLNSASGTTGGNVINTGGN